jgi:hypothetical protein
VGVFQRVDPIDSARNFPGPGGGSREKQKKEVHQGAQVFRNSPFARLTCHFAYGAQQSVPIGMILWSTWVEDKGRMHGVEG